MEAIGASSNKSTIEAAEAGAVQDCKGNARMHFGNTSEDWGCHVVASGTGGYWAVVDDNDRAVVGFANQCPSKDEAESVAMSMLRQKGAKKIDAHFMSDSTYHGGGVWKDYGPPAKLSDQEARDLLGKAGVKVWDPPHDVSLKGINKATIAAIVDLAGKIEAARGSVEGVLLVTGGTEAGYHAEGPYSHEKGFKIDLASNPTLDAYIMSFSKTSGLHRNDKAQQYQGPAGAIYAHERNKKGNGYHWDISVPSS